MPPFAAYAAAPAAVRLVSLNVVGKCATQSAGLSKHYECALAGEALGLGTLRALSDTPLSRHVADYATQRGLLHLGASRPTRDLLQRAQLAHALAIRTDDTALATLLFDRTVQCGSWFADRFAADLHNLSAVWGVPAIAPMFAVLGDPRNCGTGDNVY